MRKDSSMKQFVYQLGFLSNTQVVFVFLVFHHKSLSICQLDVQVWSTHLDMIGVEIAIDGDRPTSHPAGEIYPVRGQIDSGLGTGGAENGKTPRSRRCVINTSETF